MPPVEQFRGVSLGGWLVFETFITPYLFTLTDCDINGDFYDISIGDRKAIGPGGNRNVYLAPPGNRRRLNEQEEQAQQAAQQQQQQAQQEQPHQAEVALRQQQQQAAQEHEQKAQTVAWQKKQLLNAQEEEGNHPSEHGEKADESSSTRQCTPLEKYPTDMYTLASAFPTKEMARSYFERHWDTWVTEKDIASIAAAGLTHVKIPIGHWILGDIRDGEPWIDGEWPYFVRALRWCRKYGLRVIADIHTAPGSQNGFDNSGQLLTKATAVNWSSNPANVARSVKAVGDLAKAIAKEGLGDVVTSIEILNEVYVDVDPTVLRQFYNSSYDAIRSNLGKDTNVILSDNFDAGQFAAFWSDEAHKNTILDTHLYTVFSEKLRSMSPKQHVAFICGHYGIEMNRCCWDEDGKGRSPGLGRIIGEWTASYDTLVAAEILVVLDTIRKTGQMPKFSRNITAAEGKFLRNYVEAQMVVYEGDDDGGSNGWFFWNFKMEGGIFAEWDYLRGVEEGWIPVVKSTVPAHKRFGSCDSIVLRTDDDMTIIHEFPSPKDLPPELVEDRQFDDDVVMSHGASLEGAERADWIRHMVVFVGLALLFFAIIRSWCRRKKKEVYDPLPDAEMEGTKGSVDV